MVVQALHFDPGVCLVERERGRGGCMDVMRDGSIMEAVGMMGEDMEDKGIWRGIHCGDSYREQTKEEENESIVNST